MRSGDRGIDPGHLMEQLLPMARTLSAETGVGRLEAAVVGAAGLATLGDALRAELPGAPAREPGVRKVALAADAVTAYVGALGPQPGAVIAAGTGLIAIGTDLSGRHRADGCGHLLGDCGSGAWIGRAGPEAALRAHDGRDGGSAALPARAEEAFGPMPQLPGRIYPRCDRAAVLASFAPEVAACAAEDPVGGRRAARGGPAHGRVGRRRLPSLRRAPGRPHRRPVQGGRPAPRAAGAGVGRPAAARTARGRRGGSAARFRAYRHRPGPSTFALPGDERCSTHHRHKGIDPGTSAASACVRHMSDKYAHVMGELPYPAPCTHPPVRITA